jgi:hypothetical protein
VSGGRGRRGGQQQADEAGGRAFKDQLHLAGGGQLLAAQRLADAVGQGGILDAQDVLLLYAKLLLLAVRHGVSMNYSRL